MMRGDQQDLKENERSLDVLIETMKNSFKKQVETKHAYVTCQDLNAIEMYKDQVVIVVKAPPESQLILMDGDPPPLYLKSEKDEIDVFFCPDPNSEANTLQAALPSSSPDEPKTHQKTAGSLRRKGTLGKRSGLGSAQRNLSKAFEEMAGTSSGLTGNTPGKTAKSNLFGAFNGVASSTSSRNPQIKQENDTEEDDDVDLPVTFNSSTITKKDLLFLNDPPNFLDSDGFDMYDKITKDVKLSLFSPQKPPNSHTASSNETITDDTTNVNIDVNPSEQTSGLRNALMSELGNFSPNYLSHNDLDSRFFSLEPDADYNFTLSPSEGVLDLFDFKF